MLSRTASLLLIAFARFSSNSAHADSPHVLVFGNTIKPAHREIIQIAGRALSRFLEENHFQADFSQDTSLFQSSLLKKYSALVFLDTSEKILNPEQQKVVELYFKKGGGILSIHSSIAMGNDWPWFKSLIGNSFKSHPPIHSEKVNGMSSLLRLALNFKSSLL